MIIISGPSTVGKNPLIYEACKLYHMNYIVPATSRPMRHEEVNMKDYVFLSKDEFKTRIKNGIIKQWDYCLDNYYGYIFDFPGSGNLITHGLSRMVLRIKSQYPDDITTVFLRPKSVKRIMKTLEIIYSGRMLELRQALVEEEICHSSLFDHVLEVDNSSLDILNSNSVRGIIKEEINRQL